MQRPAEVVHLEQRGLVLADDGREDRRIDQDEAVVVEEAADGVDDRVADLADGPLPLRAQVQVAVLHQEVDAVRLGRDRVALGRRDDLGVRDGHFVAADAALLGANGPGHRERGLLAEPLELLEKLVGDLALFDDALAQTRAVADDQKLDLAAGPAVVQPAIQRYFLPDVIFQLVDVNGVVLGHTSGSFPVLGSARRDAASNRRRLPYPCARPFPVPEYIRSKGPRKANTSSIGAPQFQLSSRSENNMG